VKKNVTEKGLVDIKKINPKTLSIEEFYGSYVREQWREGVFGHV